MAYQCLCMEIEVMVGCARSTVAEGIVLMIGSMEGARLTATVADGTEPLKRLKEESCHVLLDFQLPGATETAGLVRRHFPQLRLVLLLEDELTRLKQIVQTQAKGTCSKPTGGKHFKKPSGRQRPGNPTHLRFMK